MSLDINEVEKNLLKRKKEIWNRVNLIDSEKRRLYEALPQDLDDQSIMQENDQVIDLLDQLERRELDGIDEALSRIEHGVYGICRICGDEISEKRLKAMPYATTCIECASSQ